MRARKVLLDVGESVGLSREELRAALDEGRYTGKVVSDERLAARLGADYVPTTFETKDAPPQEAERITGAQPYGGRIEAAVERALSRSEG